MKDILSLSMNKIDAVMMKTAIAFSELSYCKRAQVGAVLTRDKRIIACGYNGTQHGFENNCEDENGNTNKFTLHAEQNIIGFCAREGISMKNTVLYVTTSPCEECSKLIVSSGIKEVVYLKEYRKIEGIDYLKESKVKVRKCI